MQKSINNKIKTKIKQNKNRIKIEGEYLNKCEELSIRECGFWLNNISGIGYKRIKKLLDYFGSYKDVYDAKEEDLEKVDLMSKKNILDLINSKKPSEIKAKLKSMENKGYKFVLRDDKNYPNKLTNIYDSPHILYYRGELPDENVPSIAIIGARECTKYGMYYAYKLSSELAALGFQIISGLARGIDVVAHKGALDSEGRTYGILGCGVDICYPKENIDTFMRTIEHGGIISEYPLHSVPVQGNFPMRNRIISALCDGVLVIEARKKSGTLITVDLALDHGKEIYALPGGINSSLSEGCNNLIKNGAKIVTSINDILEDFEDYIYRRNSIENEDKHGNISNKNESDLEKNINEIDTRGELEVEEDFEKYLKKNKIFLEREEKIVYASLRLESKHIDEIVCETGFSIGEVIKILFDLEEKKLVIQRRNNYYEGLNLG